MSKERLEEIPHKIRLINHSEIVINANDYHFLYKQAERVQELEKNLEKYRNGFELQLQINNSIKKKNKRHREALYELKEYLESTIPKIPTNEKPLILTKSLEIINHALEGD